MVLREDGTRCPLSLTYIVLARTRSKLSDVRSWLACIVCARALERARRERVCVRESALVFDMHSLRARARSTLTWLHGNHCSIPAKRIVSDNTAEYILYQKEEARAGGDGEDGEDDDGAAQGLRKRRKGLTGSARIGEEAAAYDYRTVFERRWTKGSMIVNHTLSMRGHLFSTQDQDEEMGPEGGGGGGGGTSRDISISPSKAADVTRELAATSTQAQDGEDGEDDEDEDMETVLDISAGGFGADGNKVRVSLVCAQEPLWLRLLEGFRPTRMIQDIWCLLAGKKMRRTVRRSVH